LGRGSGRGDGSRRGLPHRGRRRRDGRSPARGGDVSAPMRALLVGTFVPMLRTLSSLLEAGRAHFRASRRDPDALFDATLAPGMYGVGSQVRVACDHAMESMARLVGKERPHLEHGGDTLDDLAVTIATTVAFLEGVPVDDFAGAAERTIQMPLR